MSVLNDIKRNVMPVIEILYIQRVFVIKSSRQLYQGYSFTL
jgi:hypothetical protein